MADEIGSIEGEDVAPTDVASSGTDVGIPGKLSFLTPTWINQRTMNVAAKVDALLDRIIDDGLIADGFLPFESPITDEMLARMNPYEFRTLFDTIPSLEGKAQLLERLKALKLPLPIELPYAPQGPMPASRQLAFASEQLRVPQSGISES
jgi:hypothetical protein